MKNFLKENWFKILISLMILFIGGSVFYYHIFYLPKINKQKILEQKIADCQQLGFKLYEADSKKDKELERFSFADPEFKYNDSLNKCFYKGGHQNNDTIYVFIKDVYTNEVVASYVKFKSPFDELKEGEQKSRNAFVSKYEEIFGKDYVGF